MPTNIQFVSMPLEAHEVTWNNIDYSNSWASVFLHDEHAIHL